MQRVIKAGKPTCIPCQFPALLLFLLASSVQGENGFIRTPQTQIVGLAGKDAVLRCDFSFPAGRPVSYIVEWSKRGQDVPIFILYQGYPPHVGQGYQGRLALAADSAEKASLLVRNVQRQDEGWYECKVQLLNRPPETPKNGSWIYLVVHAPPQIINGPPSEVYVKVGAESHFSCDATGTPKPKITWTKDGEAVKLTPRIITSSNSLTIRSINSGDAGTYECAAKNAEGRVSRISKLILASGAVILRPPDNLTKLEGERADLHCKAEGKPNNLTFHWSRNDSPIEPSYYTELSSRVLVQTDGTLIINPTSKTDTGKYTCRVTNGIEETPEASAWLSVEFAARITYNPSLQYLPLNLSGVIRCFIEATPAVQFVQWTKDSRVLDIKALPGMSALTNGSLFIEHVTMDHQGQYTCTPYNSHGTGGASIEMNVLVEEPPMYTTLPKTFYQGEQKGSVTMMCAAKEVPGRTRPRLYWRRSDGMAIPSDRSSTHNGALTITNLKKSDHGGYDCVLENEVATLVATSTLLIESTTPHAPANVTVEVGPFSAYIRWQPAYSGGFPPHYVIWYRLLGASSRQWRTLRVRPDDATSFTVYNLSPDTVYEFQVLSRNQLGDGLFSDAITARTLDVDSYATVFPTDASGSSYVPTIVKPSGPRPGTPTHLQISGDSGGGGAVRVIWQAPTNSSVPVMYYIVEFRKENEPWGRSSEPVSEGRTYLATKGLQPGALYEFRVYAFTLTSFSEPSEIQRFTLSHEFTGNLSPTIAITAGIVGGVCFFIISVVIVLCCIRCFKRKQHKAQYGTNGAVHINSSTALKRGMERFKARRILRSLTRLTSNAFHYLTPQKSIRISPPLEKRGYCVDWVRCRSGAESVISSSSSQCMLTRPVIRCCTQPQDFDVLYESLRAVPIRTEPTGYTTFTPTRSDLNPDSLDRKPAARSYGRENLQETIDRLRLRPTTLNLTRWHETLLLDSADSGLGLTASSQVASDRSPIGSGLVQEETPSPTRSVCVNVNRRCQSAHYPKLDPESDRRCAALLEEFRRYKSVRQSRNEGNGMILMPKSSAPFESQC